MKNCLLFSLFFTWSLIGPIFGPVSMKLLQLLFIVEGMGNFLVNQRSIGNIEKAICVFNCLGKPGQFFWQSWKFLQICYSTLLLRMVFSWTKKYKIRVSVHCSAHTKKMISIKGRKRSTLSLKCIWANQL